MVGLRIKEPKNYDGPITGTIVMMSQHDDANESHKTMVDETLTSDSSVRDQIPLELKTTKDGIVLSPQPQDNPNDPLNWPIWKRDLALLVIGFHSFIGGGQSSMLAAAFSTLEEEFGRTSDDISYLVGAFMLAMGFGSVIAAPTAVVYGKRFVYIIGIIIFFAGALWGGASKSFGSLIGARVIMGFGTSPVESLPSATIAEIYFQHERAYRLGIYTMLLLGGKNLVPMIAGFIVHGINWNWLFWILSIILAVEVVSTFLFAPETFWDRRPIPSKLSLIETEAAREVAREHEHEHEHENDQHNLTLNPKTEQNDDNDGLSDVESEVSLEAQNGPVRMVEDVDVDKIPSRHRDFKKRTWAQELAIFSGKHSQDKWWMVACRPFVLYLYPAVLFGTLIYSLSVVWLIVLSEVISNVFTNSPYNYSPTIVSLFYISPFIGGFIGSLVAGKLSDYLVRVMSTRNNGIYEPEFRLVMILPTCLSIGIGIMGFGWSSEEADLWIVPVVFFGILGFGCSLGSTTAITFAIDSYKMFAAETLVTFNFTKNVLGFCFSLFNNKFVNHQGIKDAFVVFGCIEIFVCLFALPLYIYGKRLRRWTDVSKFMKHLYVEKED